MKQPTRRGAAFPTNDAFQWLIIVAFLGLIGLVAVGPALSGSDSPLSGEGSPVRQGGYIAVTLLALIGAKPWLQPRALLSVPLPIALSLAILLVSMIWAVNPAVGIRRLLLTAAVIWTICTAVDQLGYRRAVNLMRIALLIVLVINYIAVFLFPEIGIHQLGARYEMNLGGDWRGVLLHKNFAGAMCAATILFFLFDARQMPRALRIAVIVAAAIFLYFTRSKTSVGMLVGTAAIGYLFQLTKFRFRAPAIIALTIVTLGGMIYLNIYRYAIVQLANDPKMLTGRATIWSELINYSSDHFWLGSGYGSFWNIGPNSPIYKYSNDWVRDLTAGHNGYLDLACEIGVPLAAVVVGLMLAWPFGKLIFTQRSEGGRGALTIALLTFCAGHNMTETSLLERDMTVEVVLILTIALIWKLTNTARVQRGGSLF